MIRPAENNCVTHPPFEHARNSANAMRRVDLKEIELGSNGVARMINRDIVLQLVWTNQPVSRADIARASGLQPSTVSTIVNQLLKEGWICEGPIRLTERGRHPTMLLLNDSRAILAVDIHPGQSVVAIVDLSGHILASSTLHVSKDPTRAIQSIVGCLTRLRKSCPGKSIVGIGVSVPGRVSSKTQRLVFAPNLQWVGFDLKQAIEEEMGLTVEIENAANSSLLSELWFGRMGGVQNAALVTVSEGIGVGILADGGIVTGHDGTAGEFGHIPLAFTGVLCGCGQVGCWETVASNSAAIRYYAELVPTSNEITYQELLDLAEQGDRNAAEGLERQAVFLGKGLRMLAYAFSPELVLVAGSLVSTWERIAPIIEKALTNPPLPGPPPRLQPAYDGGLARLRGAAAILLQNHFGFHYLKRVSSEHQRGMGQRRSSAAV
jgi:transcriptional regulator of PTS gene